MLCQICNKECNGAQGLTSHVVKAHGMCSKEYYDKFCKKQNEGICPVCKKETKFIKFGRGYTKHCSYACSSLDCDANKQRYLTYETTKNRTEIMANAYNRYFLKTGYKHPSQNPEVKNKKYETFIKNYELGKNKRGINKSHAENELYEYIKTIYSETILQNVRNIIPHKELDIYLPNLHKAIEYNGTYWHADPRFYTENTIVGKKQELAKNIWKNDKDKQILCEKYNIELLIIWEFDYINNKNEILNNIKNFLMST